MIAQMSAVNMDGESDNLVKIIVFDGKTVAQATKFICINRNIITVPFSYFHEKMLINRCIRSNTIFGGLIYQGGKTKYEGVYKMS